MLVLLHTLVVFVAGILIEGQGPMAMIEHWGNGFYSVRVSTLVAVFGLTAFRSKTVASMTAALVSRSRVALSLAHISAFSESSFFSSTLCSVLLCGDLLFIFFEKVKIVSKVTCEFA